MKYWELGGCEEIVWEKDYFRETNVSEKKG